LIVTLIPQWVLDVGVPILLQLRRHGAMTVDMAQHAQNALSKRINPPRLIGPRSGMLIRASSLGTTSQLYDLTMDIV